MKNLIYSIIAVFILAGCNNTSQVQNDTPDTTQTSVVQVTAAQYKASGIRVGKLERKSVAGHITVNGQLDVPPQNTVTVSAPLGGFIKSTSMLEGMHVKKGDVLAILENQEYIQLQQEYLDNRSKLTFLEEEYTRQQELARENVNARKTLQQSRSQYESVKAVVAGLKAKLAMIGISSSSLGNGEINSAVSLPAPIDGFITAVNVNVGQFVSPTDVLFKIVNLDHMHLALRVYEKDINQISTGQAIQFRLANDPTPYRASVYLIGKEINADRTVNVHCHIEKETGSMLPGMFVTAIIETASAISTVVPATAVVNYEGKQYIFIVSNHDQFKAIEVRTGATSDELTQVDFKTEIDTITTVVYQGATELMGLLKNTQE
jgi:cobalt-zinc-cadmium efflux system membrane fusion protein